jgi:hypothetical protein
MRPLPHICLFACLVAVGAGGCSSSSTKIVETWRDPVYKGPIDFKRTLVVAIDPDRYSRKTTEDTLVERIGPSRSIAGHAFLTEADRDPKKIRQRIAGSDIDGVVAIAVVGRRTITSRESSAATEEPFYSYYDRSNAFLTSDAPARYDQVYQVETRIYEVNDSGGRLIWRALSDTINPKDTRTGVRNIARAVGDELRKQKLIQ